ncbi:MAG: gamma-glutamyltransferase [Verrucomicrobia bacterium]|nr:gamma-glutamyltransferase [Verrucomicrobiota bacterium]
MKSGFLSALFLVSATMPLPAATGAGQAQESPWRPTVVSSHGMVAAGHPLAAEAGMRILRSGGNAVDAAIATWAVQGQVEPGMTGLGGDMFVLVYLAKSSEVKFINGSGFAAKAATIDFYNAKGGLPADGPLSIQIPGAVGGAVMAVQKYGSQPLRKVLAPAIEMAETGFPISDNLARALRGSRAKLAKFESTKKIWFKGDQPLEAGDSVVNKDLARTLRAIAAGGAGGFYKGPVAKNTAEYLRTHGGIITEQDLASYSADEDAPIRTAYRGIDVYECPPNSQGIVMLEALNILEGFDLRSLGHNSVPYLHLVTEALKLSFADRNKYIADPKFTPGMPVKELLAKEYAAVRRRAIDPSRAIEGEPAPGNPRAAAGAAQVYGSPRGVPSVVTALDPDQLLHLTTYLAVVDKDRNMVSVTSSLLSGFGSGMVAEGNGFILNDRMRYFWLEADDVNALQPGKRVRQTINPALAVKDGRPFVVFGTPGADTQPQTQLQFFLNVVEFGMGVQPALEQAAVISNSFRGSYHPHAAEGKLLTPHSLPDAVKQGLAKLGHRLDLRNARGVGAVKAILIDPRTGALMGGVSPTGDSYVVAY